MGSWTVLALDRREGDGVYFKISRCARLFSGARTARGCGEYSSTHPLRLPEKSSHGAVRPLASRRRLNWHGRQRYRPLRGMIMVVSKKEMSFVCTCVLDDDEDKSDASIRATWQVARHQSLRRDRRRRTPSARSRVSPPSAIAYPTSPTPDSMADEPHEQPIAAMAPLWQRIGLCFLDRVRVIPSPCRDARLHPSLRPTRSPS